MLQLAMPEMPEAPGEELGKGALAVLSRYGDPRHMLRLGRARLAQVLIKATTGAWRERKAEQILFAARAAVELWGDLEGCDFTEVAEDPPRSASSARSSRSSGSSTQERPGSSMR